MSLIEFINVSLIQFISDQQVIFFFKIFSKYSSPFIEIQVVREKQSTQTRKLTLHPESSTKITDNENHNSNQTKKICGERIDELQEKNEYKAGCVICESGRGAHCIAKLPPPHFNGHSLTHVHTFYAQFFIIQKS